MSPPPPSVHLPIRSMAQLLSCQARQPMVVSVGAVSVTANAFIQCLFFFKKDKNKTKKTEEHVQISYTEGRGKFSGRGKSPNVKHSVWCEREKNG